MQKLQILLIFIGVQVINGQFVYTQLKEFKEYGINTNQDNLQVDLGRNFQSTKKYSIWGWYKSNLSNPAISNIITLKNLSGSEAFIRTQFNNDFPACLYTSNQLNENPDLKTEEQVVNNPNCDYDNLNQGNREDLLYVNYDLSPAENDTQKYSIVFLIQNGKENGISTMTLEGFTDLERSDSWAFFGISADYTDGSVTIYHKILDGQNAPLIKSFAINYPDFELKRNAILILAGVEPNPYFDSISGFLGTIGNIEMSRFYTPNIAFQWIGYAPETSRQYNNVIIDFIFDNYDKNENLQNYGVLNKNFAQPGEYTPLFLLDSNRIGNQYYSNSFLPLNEIDFRANNSPNKSMLFLYFLQFEEDLPEQQRLLTRGQQGENGYLEINLNKTPDGRKLNMKATGDEGKQVEWNGPTTFKAGERYYFLVGLANSIGNSLRPIYIDSVGGNDFAVLNDNFSYDFGPQDITLFSNNPQTVRTDGFINMYRFIAFDSGSPAVNFFNKYSSKPLRDQINVLGLPQDKLCALRTSYYERAGCIFCKDSIVNQNRQCINYCPAGFKNGLNDMCIPCVEDNCNEINTVKWNFDRVDNDTWKLTPNRKIINFNQVDYNRLFNISIDGEQKSSDTFKYEVTPNEDNQEVIVDFDFRDPVRDDDMVLVASPDPEKPIFDENRNLVRGSTDDEYIDRVCYVSQKRKTAMRVLAFIILCMFILTFLVLMLATIFCWGHFEDLGGLWKFFLHHWMKLQLVAFFILLCVYMPCCIKAFLHTLYKYAVSWDHHLREWIDEMHDSSDYDEGFVEKRLPERFRDEYVKPFILHNMGIFFIVHLVILLAYLIVKIWDCFQTTAQSCFFKLLVFLEFTFMIVGFLLVHMQIFVFSFINFRKATWDHAYFVICFIIAVLYIAVFGIFWLYCLYRLTGPQEFFIGNNNGNKFYYFFAGFRNHKYARTYDLWYVLAHFLVGMAIGLLIHECLAQMIIVVAALIVLFVILLILRPWRSIWLLIADIISQLLILAAVIIFFIFYLLDRGGCKECGDREGVLCWVVVILLFLALLIPLLLLLLATLLGFLNKNKTIVEEQNFYHHTVEKEVINNYEEVNERYLNQEQGHMLQDEIHIDENIRENQVLVNKTENLGISQNKNMDEFLEEAHMHSQIRNERFVQGIQGDSFTKPTVVRPDDADEESFQGQIIEALANKDEDYKIEQDKNELEGRSRLVSRKKQEFYNIISDRDISAINTERLNSRNLVQSKRLHENVFDGGDDIVERVEKKIITKTIEKNF